MENFLCLLFPFILAYIVYDALFLGVKTRQELWDEITKDWSE